MISSSFCLLRGFAGKQSAIRSQAARTLLEAVTWPLSRSAVHSSSCRKADPDNACHCLQTKAEPFDISWDLDSVVTGVQHWVQPCDTDEGCSHSHVCRCSRSATRASPSKRIPWQPATWSGCQRAAQMSRAWRSHSCSSASMSKYAILFTRKVTVCFYEWSTAPPIFCRYRGI